MKKLYIITILLFITASISYSQSGWFWQNPLPQGNDLNCIKFLDVNTGWAVGKKGTIIKTTDSGDNWVIQDSKTFETLYSVLFVSENIGIVVGERGAILRTSNGGLNWENVFTLANTKFNGIFFQNQQTGWVCGYDNNNDGYGMIYKTTNAGVTWILNFRPSGSGFYEIYFLNAATGFADTGVYFYKTTNGGNNWAWIGYLSYSLDFEMIDSLNIISAGGYIQGSTPHGIIRKSTNGGSNIATTIINIVDTLLRSVDFINVNTGFVVGDKGKILKTTNLGNNWSRILSPSNANLNSVYFEDSIKGFIAGEFGTLHSTSNSGDNWGPLNEGITGNTLSSVVFLNSNTGMVAGQSYILKTTNGGNLWEQKFIDPAIYWNKLQMIDENTGFAFCSYKNLYKTTNAGENWSFVAPITVPTWMWSYTINSVQFVDPNIGYACGYTSEPNPPSIQIRAAIYKTQNGGENWVLVYHAYSSGILHYLSFVDQNTGIIVGSNKIIKTENGGLNWSTNNSSVSINRVQYLNDSNIWIVSNESIMKSVDGGVNWQTRFTQSGELFTFVRFIDEHSGWVTSKRGSLYATSNGGENWFFQNTPNQYGLNDVFFVSPNTGWVIGDRGIILKTISGVIPNALNPISEGIPILFSLHQNYPNPFNPVTKIKFDIPTVDRDRSVKIIIYDLLGREVVTLVNEQLMPGSYEVDWDGSGFASGVYFYSLVSQDFVETKRMVLLK